jgi:hypothetical protein
LLIRRLPALLQVAASGLIELASGGRQAADVSARPAQDPGEADRDHGARERSDEVDPEVVEVGEREIGAKGRMSRPSTRTKEKRRDEKIDKP